MVTKKDRLKKLRYSTRCVHCPIKERALYQVFTDDYIEDAQNKRQHQYELKAKSSLYKEGEDSGEAYTLFAGWLLLYRMHSDGSRQGLRVALPGDFVGYSSLIEKARNHSALSLTDSVLCGFKQSDLHSMMHNHPALSMQVTMFQSKDMAQCQMSMLGIGKKTAESRIAYLILELYERQHNRGLVDDGALTMPFPLTQEVISDLTGLTQVHVNRVISHLKSSQLIGCQSKQLTILDKHRLADIGEFTGLPNDH